MAKPKCESTAGQFLRLRKCWTRLEDDPDDSGWYGFAGFTRVRQPRCDGYRVDSPVGTTIIVFVAAQVVDCRAQIYSSLFRPRYANRAKRSPRTSSPPESRGIADQAHMPMKVWVRVPGQARRPPP